MEQRGLTAQLKVQLVEGVDPSADVTRRLLAGFVVEVAGAFGQT